MGQSDHIFARGMLFASSKATTCSTAARVSDHFPVVASTNIPGGVRLAWESPQEERTPPKPINWKVASSFDFKQGILEGMGRPDAGS
eukprot:9558459-Alexandrium_andersonii.AAC.1